MKKYKYPVYNIKRRKKDKEKEMMKITYSLMFGMLISLLAISTFLADTQIGVIQSLPPVKQFQCIQLKQVCGTCTYNNITSVSYPNSSIALGEVQMTKTGNEYTYEFCSTVVLGKYIVNGYGNPSGSIETWAYDFNVTTTGQEGNNTIPLFLALGGFIIFITAVLIRNEYFGFLSGAIFIVCGIYLMIYGLVTIADLYTRTLSFVSLGFGLLLLLASSYEAITSNKIRLFGVGVGVGEEDE
jgi:hypothetical protein